MTQSPCYTCSNRTMVCHATCTAYRDWTVEVHKERAALNIGKEADAHTKMVTDKIRKRRNRR